jgi:hypothetical protein
VSDSLSSIAVFCGSKSSSPCSPERAEAPDPDPYESNPHSYKMCTPNVIANVRYTWAVRVRSLCDAEKLQLNSDGGDCGSKKCK